MECVPSTEQVPSNLLIYEHGAYLGAWRPQLTMGTVGEEAPLTHGEVSARKAPRGQQGGGRGSGKRQKRGGLSVSRSSGAGQQLGGAQGESIWERLGMAMEGQAVKTGPPHRGSLDAPPRP